MILQQQSVGYVNAIADGAFGTVIKACRKIANTVNYDCKIPSIAVIGSTSAGKSSTLERLVGYTLFPRANGVCTKIEFVLSLRYNSKPYYAVRLRTSEPRTRRDSVSSLTEDTTNVSQSTQTGIILEEERLNVNDARDKDILKAVERLQNRVISELPGDSQFCTDKLIEIEIHGTHLPDITLIDLPGIRTVTAESQEQTEMLTNQYINDPNCLLLLILAANDNTLDNSPVYHLLEQAKSKLNHNPWNRVFCVLTNCDNVPTKKLKILRKRILKEKQEATSELLCPVVAVINRDTEDDEVLSMEQAVIAEKSWFSDHLPDIDPSLLSISALYPQLNEKIRQFVLQFWLPNQFQQVETIRQNTQAQLDKLGETPSIEILNTMLNRFGEHVSSIVFDSQFPETSLIGDVANALKTMKPSHRNYSCYRSHYHYFCNLNALITQKHFFAAVSTALIERLCQFFDNNELPLRMSRFYRLKDKCKEKIKLEFNKFESTAKEKLEIALNSFLNSQLFRGFDNVREFDWRSMEQEYVLPFISVSLMQYWIMPTFESIVSNSWRSCWNAVEWPMDLLEENCKKERADLVKKLTYCDDVKRTIERSFEVKCEELTCPAFSLLFLMNQLSETGCTNTINTLEKLKNDWNVEDTDIDTIIQVIDESRGCLNGDTRQLASQLLLKIDRSGMNKEVERLVNEAKHYSPDCNWIKPLDQAVRLENATYNESTIKKFVLNGHTSRVCSVAFSPDGKTIVSGSFDNTIRLWNVETQQQIGQPLNGHTNTIWSLAFSPDGKTIVSGSGDNTIRLWNVETQQQIGQPLDGHAIIFSVAFSPDGKTIVSGSFDNTIRLWNVETQQQVGQPLNGHTNSVVSVAFSPDGKTIVSGSNDNTIRLWNVETQQQIGQPLNGHTCTIESVAFSPGGKAIVSGSQDTTIRLWNVETQQQIGRPLYGHTTWVWSVAFSPDGKTIVSGSYDTTIRLWNVETQQQIGRPLNGHTHYVRSVAFSPDGKTIVSGSEDNTIRLWKDKTQIECIAINNNGTIIQSRGSVGNISYYSIKDGSIADVANFDNSKTKTINLKLDGKQIFFEDSIGFTWNHTPENVWAYELANGRIIGCVYSNGVVQIVEVVKRI